MNRWTKVSVLMVMLFCLGAVAASASASDTLVMARHDAEIRNLDPHMTTASSDVVSIDFLYNALVRFRPGNVNPEFIEPDLAESWEVSEDGLEWIFYLREGVQFHKGYGELTAEDVVFSLQKAADPDRSIFSGRFTAFETIEALDDYTVRLQLSELIPSVLGVLADFQSGFILSKKAYEELGEEFRSNPIGTGPFMLDEHIPGERITFLRHEEYFRGTPLLRRVVLRNMPDTTTRELALQTGEVHLITGVVAQWWVDDIRARMPEVVIDTTGPGSLMHIHINTSMPPLDDLTIRQAIAHALDVEGLTEWVGLDIAEPAYSIVPGDNMGATDDVQRYPYDPERSRELLAEAGYPDGLDLGDVVITNNVAYIEPMEIIQEMLADAGITVTLQVVDHATFHERIRDNVSPLVLYTARRFPIAENFLREFYHSDSIVGKPTAVTNFSHYDAIDELIDAAASEPDAERQIALWEQAQIQAAKDIPAVPLYLRLSVAARRPELVLGYELQSAMIGYAQINELTYLED